MRDKLTPEQMASIAKEIDNPEKHADFGPEVTRASDDDDAPNPKPKVAKAKPKGGALLAPATALSESCQPVMERSGPNPNLLRSSDAEGGFVFVEAIPCSGDSGYGEYIRDRAKGAVERAFASVASDYSNLPDFAPGNRVVVMVAVLEG